MKIVDLSARDFKSLRRTTLRPKAVNLFVGANGGREEQYFGMLALAFGCNTNLDFHLSTKTLAGSMSLENKTRYSDIRKLAREWSKFSTR
jgi:predicted ATPase